MLLRTAWLCDDAYISFRVADNFVNGFGLRWNVAERVQAFTNPLWTLLVAALHFVTREVYYTSLGLCLTVSLLAALVLSTRAASSPPGGLLALALLTASKAYADYSTSGLENPLTHLIAVLFCVFLFEEPKDTVARDATGSRTRRSVPTTKGSCW